jgi:cytochrome c553
MLMFTRSRLSVIAAPLFAGLAALLALPAAVSAADDAAQQRLRNRALAATCAHCHGTDGRSVAGEPLIRLAGLPKDHLYTQLLAFRTGSRPATIMHQITKGYSQEQLEQVATYFSQQSPGDVK